MFGPQNPPIINLMRSVPIFGYFIVGIFEVHGTSNILPKLDKFCGHAMFTVNIQVRVNRSPALGLLAESFEFGPSVILGPFFWGLTNSVDMLYFSLRV